MFSSSNNNKDYNQLSLDEFSDDDDDDIDTTNNNNNNNNVARSRNGVGTTNNTNQRASSSSYNSNYNNNNNNTNGSSNHSFQQQQQQQQMMMQKQDEGLELLGHHVEQLGQMSLQIHEELNSQNQLLDDIDTELDTTTQMVQSITQRTRDFITASGGTNTFVLILSLAIIAIVLFLLILYT